MIKQIKQQTEDAEKKKIEQEFHEAEKQKQKEEESVHLREMKWDLEKIKRTATHVEEFIRES